MANQLNAHELEVILRSLRYSKQRVVDAPETPRDVRHAEVDELGQVAKKVSAILKTLAR